MLQLPSQQPLALLVAALQRQPGHRRRRAEAGPAPGCREGQDRRDVGEGEERVQGAAQRLRGGQRSRPVALRSQGDGRRGRGPQDGCWFEQSPRDTDKKYGVAGRGGMRRGET